jgi:hypothetical protein
VSANAGQQRLFDSRGPREGRLQHAVEQTVEALSVAGRLEAHDMLLVALTMTAAAIVDDLADDPAMTFHRCSALKIAYSCERALRELVPPEIDVGLEALFRAANGVSE